MEEANRMSDKEFQDTIDQGVVLVDFNASWCAPCRAQDPIIRQLATRFEGKATVISLDIDANRDVALQLTIHSIPTPILFENGREIQRFVGLQSEFALSQAIENVLI